MLLFYWKVSASQCKPMSSKRRQLLPRNTHASSLPNYSEQESDDQNTTENVHQPKRTRENLRIVITKTADGNWGKGRPWNKWATHCKFSLQNSNGRWAFSPGRHASSTLSASHSVLWRHRLRAVCFKSLSLTNFKTKTRFFTDYTTCAWITRPDFLQFYFKKVRFSLISVWYRIFYVCSHPLWNSRLPPHVNRFPFTSLIDWVSDLFVALNIAQDCVFHFIYVWIAYVSVLALCECVSFCPTAAIASSPFPCPLLLTSLSEIAT